MNNQQNLLELSWFTKSLHDSGDVACAAPLYSTHRSNNTCEAATAAAAAGQLRHIKDAYVF
jgi:hypothetical protein